MLYYVETTSNFWGDDPIVEYDSLDDAARIAMDCGVDTIDDDGNYSRPMTLAECRDMAESDLRPLPDIFAGRGGVFGVSVYNDDGVCLSDAQCAQLELALDAVHRIQEDEVMLARGARSIILVWWTDLDEIGAVVRWRYEPEPAVWLLEMANDTAEIL